MSRIVVEPGSLSEIARYLGPPCKVALVSDATVMALYGNAVTSALQAEAFEIARYSFPSGESQKPSLRTALC